MRYFYAYLDEYGAVKVDGPFPEPWWETQEGIRPGTVLREQDGVLVPVVTIHSGGAAVYHEDTMLPNSLVQLMTSGLSIA